MVGVAVTGTAGTTGGEEEETGLVAHDVEVAVSSVVDVNVDFVAFPKSLCCWTVERKSDQQRPL